MGKKSSSLDALIWPFSNSPSTRIELQGQPEACSNRFSKVGSWCTLSSCLDHTELFTWMVSVNPLSNFICNREVFHSWGDGGLGRLQNLLEVIYGARMLPIFQLWKLYFTSMYMGSVVEVVAKKLIKKEMENFIWAKFEDYNPGRAS